MKILKKSAQRQSADAQPFVVPSLTEVSPEYAALVERKSALQTELAELSTEDGILRAQIDADKTREMRPSVAELLGDPASGKAMMRKRLAEIKGRAADLEAAIDIVSGRIADTRTKASVAVCEMAKPEYGRRVAAICAALEAVQAARADYAALVDEFERNDIAWLRLGPMTPRFLGDPRDGHLARYLMEARQAGYF